MKYSFNTLRKIAKYGILALIILCVIFVEPLHVFADVESGNNDVHSVNTDSVFYDPSSNECGVTGGSTSGLPGAAALEKQVPFGLDAKWKDAILNSANKVGADPIAMAALMFWENRSFPEYKTTWNGSDSGGRGPWQITRDTWPDGAGDYSSGVDDPVKSTDVAATVVIGKGGVANLANGLGSIKQDFSQGSNLQSVATVAKNYNAGGGTFRTPGVADLLQPDRSWIEGNKGPWYGDKQSIIDYYVVGMTYAYYQIATGQKITWQNDAQYGAEAVAHQADLAGFKPGSGTALATTDPTTPAPAPTPPAGNKPVIVIDPGHSGQDKTVVDPATGINDHDYPNTPEMSEVWSVSNLVKTKLEADGYSVIFTKKNENDYVSLRGRADVANQANAALAVSIHNDHSQSFANFAKVSPQRVGLYRTAPNGSKVEFTNATVAQKSQAYATNFQAARNAAEGRNNTSTDDIVFDGRSGIAPGNLGLVQLFANVPWVYNEVGASEGLDAGLQEKYAKGIVDGIEKSVPSSGATTINPGGTCDTGGGIVQGSIVQTAINFSWDDGKPHGKNQADARPSFQEAMPKYNGATATDPYSDCGVFVATVMVASGADPDYVKRGTKSQQPYLDSSPKYQKITDNVTSTSQLLPGDILITNYPGKYTDGHTFIYVGPQPSGFNEASASLGGTVPVLANVGWELGQHFSVYRLKG